MNHIVLLTTSYPDGVPGAEAAGSFVADFAAELSRHTRVTVLAAGARDATETSENLTVIRFAVPRLPLSLLSPLRPDHWSAIIGTLRAGHRALEQLLQESRPNHVLALWALPAGYWAAKLATRYGCKFSVWALGSDIWGLGKIPLVRGVLRRVLQQADGLYADGYLLAADVEKLCGRKCEFLPSTRRLLPTVASEKSPGVPYRLAFLGRWHPNKGVDLLLAALQQLDDSDWSAIAAVRICGGGPLHDAVHTSVHALQASGRPITVHGYLDKVAAADLIGWADYLMLPSRIESIPVIFSDAVQLQTPIIATPVGDLPRLQEQYQFGVLAEQATASAYAAAIRAALAMSAASFRPKLAEAQRDFDLAAIAQRFLRAATDP